MKRIEGSFRHKKVDFTVIKRGKKAIILKAVADFLHTESVEVWQIRERKEVILGGSIIEAAEIKPGNADYPFSAHQFLQYNYANYEDMMAVAEKRFQEYELGIRPRQTTD